MGCFFIFSTGAQSEKKRIPAQRKTPACGFGVGLSDFFVCFFLFFISPTQFARFAAACSCKGKRGLCSREPAWQSPGKTRHLLFPAAKGGRAQEGSEPRNGESPHPGQCKYWRKAEREAWLNLVNAVPWLDRTRQCREWRCLCRCCESGSAADSTLHPLRGRVCSLLAMSAGCGTAGEKATLGFNKYLDLRV